MLEVRERMEVVMARLTLVATLLLLLSGSAVLSAADAPPTPDVGDDPRVTDAIDAWQAWLEFQLGIHGVPGASFALVHDQTVLRMGAIGEADPEAGRSATVDTLYSVCSISKLFTSIAVMQLRDRGLVSLDEPIATYLDWYDLEDVHPDDEPITLRRILTHSSGLPRESDHAYWTEPDFPFPTRDDIIARLGEQRTLYPSGRYFQYSNLGLTLAGEIVSAVDGRSYDSYIREEILTPLGMHDTFTEIPAQHRDGRFARGYSARRSDGHRDQMSFFQVRGIAPAAGFASTATDLATFATWQLRLRHEGAPQEVLRPATLREMQRVHWVDPDWEDTWGLGFHVAEVDGRTVVGHSGGCPGFYSVFSIAPESEMAVIVLTNAIGSEIYLYSSQAMAIVEPAITRAVEDPDDVPERDPAFDRYVGHYRSAWGDSAIVRWNDGLAEVWLGSRDLEDALTELDPVGEHLFRRVRDDDGSLGEEFEFEIGTDGRATRYRSHGNWMVRVE
jgi:CubicO group peptidase (beta-lactamase class C family)